MRKFLTDIRVKYKEKTRLEVVLIPQAIKEVNPLSEVHTGVKMHSGHNLLTLTDHSRSKPITL